VAIQYTDMACETISIANKLVSKYWHPICLKSEIFNNNDFMRFEILGFELIVYNDNGHIIVFDNLCPHRGARFFMDDAGKEPIRCKYHGWGYSNGRLNIANKKSFTRCDVTAADLNKFHVDFCGDFIFFAVDPIQSLKKQLGGRIYDSLAEISSQLSGCSDVNRYFFESAWAIALENALEPYHVPLIHVDTLAILQLTEGENFFLGNNSIWHSRIGNERLDKRLRSMKKYFSTGNALEGYSSIFIFPFSMLSSTYGFSYSLQNFFPSLQDNQTYFTSRLYSALAADSRYQEVVDAFIQSTAKMNRKIFEEDHQVCKRIPARTWTSKPPKYFSDLEEKVLHFRKSCSVWADI